MLSIAKRIKLSDGFTIPILGYGTYLCEGGEAEKCTLHAIKTGYRHIDTATLYNNEDDIGKVVRNCDLPREELFVTTKLWYTDHGRDKATEAFHTSLKRLGLSYVDLYLIHSPSGGKILETWDAITDLQCKGLIRSIGVSNFSSLHLTELMKARPDHKPQVNQIEISPFVTREDTVAFCKSNDIVVEAYSPLTKGLYLNDSKLVSIAKKYDRSSAQILIRWSLQRGYVVMPKSSNIMRIEENANVFDFEIAEEDMRTMNGWDEGKYTSWNVIAGPWLP